VGEVFLDRRDELVDEAVVLFPPDPVMAHAEIEGVVLEGDVGVGPRINVHRQAPGRVDLRAGRVEGELAHGDPHARDPQGPQPQDPFAVGDDDDADILVEPRMIVRIG
jgi:hypothetical protein